MTCSVTTNTATKRTRLISPRGTFTHLGPRPRPHRTDDPRPRGPTCACRRLPLSWAGHGSSGTSSHDGHSWAPRLPMRQAHKRQHNKQGTHRRAQSDKMSRPHTHNRRRLATAPTRPCKREWAGNTCALVTRDRTYSSRGASRPSNAVCRPSAMALRLRRTWWRARVLPGATAHSRRSTHQLVDCRIPTTTVQMSSDRAASNVGRAGRAYGQVGGVGSGGHVSGALCAIFNETFEKANSDAISGL